MGFAGQVAVVTGASSGIGRELARHLAAGGAKVGLVARRRDLLDRLAADLGGSVVAAPADVADRAQLDAAVSAIRHYLGPIDVMIANAGVGMPTHLDPVNVADVEAMVRVNVLGVVYAFAAVLPEMLARRRNRTAAVGYDRHLYKGRNVVERFFGRVKQYRRVATRYDKKAANYRGFVWLASIQIMLT